jgi:hypothetical protein
MGGEVVRMRPVTAYASMGSKERKRQRTALEMKPSFRRRTLSRSIALDAVQVSSAARRSKSAWEILDDDFIAAAGEVLLTGQL